ncbi:MAG: tyrosine-type recombinase/integrase [Sandarakinorhabdus sp.]|nr:tyrosine-type recombinase/integrase [Sandarakinorhabdus sp.]
MAKPPKRLPVYVTEFRDNRGAMRLRFRRKGQAVHYFKAAVFSPDWWAEYQACLAMAPAHAEKLKPGADRVVPGTVEALIVRYYQSARWKAKSEATRRNQGATIERARRAIGKAMVKAFGVPQADLLLAKMVDRPGAANNMRKALKAIWAWAVAAELASANPWDATARLKGRKGGFHTWTDAEIDAFRKHWGPGTRERLALLLILNTCQRRGDAIRLGPDNVRVVPSPPGSELDSEPEQRLIFRQGKTGTDMDLPVIGELRAELKRHRSEAGKPFLLTEYGRPFTAAGFGNWFGDKCKAAGVPGRAHGLRKAAATRLANAGATQQQLKAWGGWKNDAEVATYVQNADRARQADQSAHMMASRQSPLAISAFNTLDGMDNSAPVVTPTGLEPVFSP